MALLSYLYDGVRHANGYHFKVLRGVSHTLASNDFGNPKSIPLVRGTPYPPLIENALFFSRMLANAHLLIYGNAVKTTMIHDDIRAEAWIFLKKATRNKAPQKVVLHCC